MQVIVISADNVNTFKYRLHRFLPTNNDYDYKSTLTGTGNRCFVDIVGNT